MKKYLILATLLFAMPTYGLSNTTVLKKNHNSNHSSFDKHTHVVNKPYTKVERSSKHKLHEKVKRAKQKSSLPELPMTDEKMQRILEKYQVPSIERGTIILAINEAAEKHKVSKKLIVAIIAKESSFKRRAVSRHGALGLLQIMPVHKVKNPFDIKINIDKGTEILATYIEESGSVGGGLARYGNCRSYVNAVYNTMRYITTIG